MGVKSRLSIPFARYVTDRTLATSRDPLRAQERVLKYLLRKAKQTSFGVDHGFKDIRGYQDLKDAVPLTDYEGMRPYVDRIVRGEPNVLWPGTPLYLCKTSGTTSGAKYIPLTKELLSNQIGSAKNALLSYIARTGSADFVDGKMIFIQGSPELDNSGAIPVGRLSGIVARHVPAYLQRNRLPSYETNTIKDWERKVDAIVDETIKEDLRLISGIPSWVQMYFEKLLEKTGRNNVLEIFPNFSLFVHGGVNYAPYQANMERLIGAAIPSIETFPASEGFFAYQDGPDTDGLLLVVDKGIFYEFIPSEDVGKPNARRIRLDQVELGKNYALVLNTAAGLWGYQIGDMVQFTSLVPARIRVVGRTKHFTSTFGEHVIAIEVERALKRATESHSCEIVEFTVAPCLQPVNGLPHHQWFIEFATEPADLQGFTSLLDKEMRKQNPYYRDLVDGKVLQPLQVVRLKVGSFNRLMESIGRLGGQNKVPRLSNDRKLADPLVRERLND